MDEAEAIRTAALCLTPDGKRHGHQRRIPPATLREAAARLARAKLWRAQTFDELHGIIDATCGELDRFGPLTCYDIAVRVGAHFGLEPERVYLHTGTSDGARALGLPHRRATLGTGKIPHALRRLNPGEVEDFLCIYKDRLAECAAL